jgi:uncharacterized membrane protein
VLRRELLVLVAVLARDNRIPRLDVLSSAMAVQIFVGLALVQSGLHLIGGCSFLHLPEQENDLTLEEIVQCLRFLFYRGQTLAHFRKFLDQVARKLLEFREDLPDLLLGRKDVVLRCNDFGLAGQLLQLFVD